MSFNSDIRECESDESRGLSPIRKIAIFALVAVGVFFSLRATTQPVSASAAASTSPVTVTKNIEDIEVGDLVLSRDEHGTTVAPRSVKEVYRRTSFHLRNLTFRDDAGNEQTLQTTDEHPFWSVSDNAFVDAGTLQIGTKVTSPDGDLQTLVATTRDERPDGVAVFNFQVNGFHTYYVAARSASPSSEWHNRILLVHNSDCGFFDGTTYSEKVMNQMTGGPGEFHSFPDLVTNFEADGTVRRLVGGDGIPREMLTIPGSYTSASGRAVDGTFEFIKEADGVINHRYFNANLLGGN